MTKKTEAAAQTGTKLTEANALRMVTEWLQGQLLRAKSTIEKFKKELDEHPAHAMEWAGGAFRAAAMTQVFGEHVRVLTAEGSKVTVDSMQKHLLREVQSMAQNPSRSTSATTNLLAMEKLACWAEVLEFVNALKTTLDA